MMETLMSFLISLNGWMETDEWMEIFNELFNLRAEDIAGLHSWLARKHSYTSHPIQNDILRIMCHMVLRKIIKEVNDQSINVRRVSSVVTSATHVQNDLVRFSVTSIE